MAPGISCVPNATADKASADVTFPEETEVGADAAARSISQPQRTKHETFMREVVEFLLNEAVFDGLDRTRKVNHWMDPESLRVRLDGGLRQDPETDEQLLERIKDVVTFSVKTGHPRFMNQLFSGLDPYGLVGQWVTDALNPSVYTYEVSPVFTLLEMEVLTEMRKIVGWGARGDGDGLIAPGGSIANMYAIICARYKARPEIKVTIANIERSWLSNDFAGDLNSIFFAGQKQGLFGGPPLVMYTSDAAHYSLVKSAMAIGLGSDNCVMIPCDGRGRMSPIALRQAILQTIEDGRQPFLVSATSGTTVFGAFDPLIPISQICEEFGLWFHVDAAWGGGALMSRKHRHKLHGIEKADSVTWNPHKLLAAPQQCSVLLVKQKDVLTESNATNAAYLFQKDKFYDTSYDTGDKHLQCGRRADIFKFWLMWKAKGTRGFECHVDRLFENAAYLTQLLRRRKGFRLVLDQPECTNVCFWYIPPSFEKLEGKPELASKLNQVAPKIKERMIKEGTLMITYQPSGALPNFFRVVLQNSATTKADMEFLVKEIERLGEDL